MIIDHSSASKFLSAIAPDGDVVFQTFDDDETRKDVRLGKTTRDSSVLQKYQDKGAGVFATINRVDGDKRLKSKISEIRAIFADFDVVGSLPDEWEIEPSMIVESSPGKHHAYWIIDGNFPIDEFAVAQKALAARLGTDSVINDPSRVLRIPGYWHQKSKPFQVHIVEMTGQVYSCDELRSWLEWTKEKTVDRKPYKPAKVDGDNPYVKSAVEKALRNIATAPGGSRNNVLNSEAFGIFGLVKSGHVQETIREEIINAARANGLADGEIIATVDSAWRSSEAREVPERRMATYQPPEVVGEYDTENGEFIETRGDNEFPVDEPQKATEPKPQERHDHGGWNAFRFLGYNKGEFFYLPRGSKQIVSMRASEHTKLRMIELASLNFWQEQNGGTKPSKEAWEEFANAMMRQSEQVGVFDETKVRGRGAWVDGKAVIVHTGSEAHIDGNVVSLSAIKSKFIYEASAPWEFGFGDPCTPDDARKLATICERLTWVDKMAGALMAGWCVIAPVSGALKWRPHVWVTGPSGSGKSTAIDIIRRVVGPSAEAMEGKTTEAAIRQKMGYDARPVILDEVESEDASSAQKVQAILDLARVASSGGTMSKGTANHKAVNFTIRSCFCFSSINTAVRQKADESRVSPLILTPNRSPDKEQHYQDLVRDVTEWFDEKYASRMFSRTVANLRSLLKNCETFTAAAAIEFKSRRAADQIGPMLAGYYLCFKTDEITTDAAIAFIRKHDWTDYVALNSETDDVRIFQFIVSRMIKVSAPNGTVDVTIGTAIDEARTETGRGPYTMALGARGIKVDYDFIGISDNADNTRALFKERPEWSANWKEQLRNIPGAVKSSDSERFAGGIKSRLTWIPMAHLSGTYREREVGEEG